ncbi:S-layer homology domain-containing protein [Pseudoclavibacter soli]|uniref:S-layer homology domain-containing protein n=1 Tax=Pseudoclavibacter soli TaxID=452623 RepID=UPI0003F89C25|nr:S-layer homology domain-containing protein [Pseudoclavibacter soli]
MRAKRMMALASIVLLGVSLQSQTAFASTGGAITDAGLRACINEELGKSSTHDPTNSELATLQELSCSKISHGAIKSLSGLDKAVNLTSLSIYDGDFSTVSPLNALKSLESLSLGSSDSLKALDLHDLPRLSMIYAPNSGLTTLTGLKNLPALATLKLRGNQISDVSAVSGLTALISVDLSDNKIKNASAFKGMSRISTLDLAKNQIADVTSLTGLNSQISLGLGSNKVTDFSALKYLTWVTTTNQKISLNAVTDGTNTYIDAYDLRAKSGERVSSNWALTNPVATGVSTRDNGWVVLRGVYATGKTIDYGYGAGTATLQVSKVNYALSTAPSRFLDVYNISFERDIYWAVDKGIAKGWDDGTFRPYEGMTRDAFAAFLYRYAGSPKVSVSASFPDIAGNQHADAIRWMAAEGITTGYEDGLFHPERTITRDALAAFLYRYAGSPSVSGTTTLNDVSNNQHVTAITWLSQSKITTGYPDGGYHPYATVTRDAFAAFLHRYDTKYGN